jgi:zona occludens toxin (predicted ATPase)
MNNRFHSIDIFLTNTHKTIASTENLSFQFFWQKYRHFHLDFMIAAQSFRKIPLVIRNCANQIVFFKLNNERELEKIDDEYGSLFSPQFIQIAKKITAKKYDFCYLNLDELKMYHNFDTLVLDAGE